MSDLCDARIRPMTDGTEVVCGLTGEHSTHRGVLRDYAHPGSATTLQWEEDDRRTYHGEWPGQCPGCILPIGHRGGHAQ